MVTRTCRVCGVAVSAEMMAPETSIYPARTTVGFGDTAFSADRPHRLAFPRKERARICIFSSSARQGPERDKPRPSIKPPVLAGGGLESFMV
jgi:hypothetical protein